MKFFIHFLLLGAISASATSLQYRVRRSGVKGGVAIGHVVRPVEAGSDDYSNSASLGGARSRLQARPQVRPVVNRKQYEQTTSYEQNSYAQASGSRKQSSQDDGSYRPGPGEEEADSEPIPDSIGGVKGQAGVDYPAYKKIPETNFDCASTPYNYGMYADESAQCQVYHVCFDGRKESFLCGVGTVFNQAILSCDYWHAVDCGKTKEFYAKNEELGKASPEPGQANEQAAVAGGVRQQQPQEQYVPQVEYAKVQQKGAYKQEQGQYQSQAKAQPKKQYVQAQAQAQAQYGQQQYAQPQAQKSYAQPKKQYAKVQAQAQYGQEEQYDQQPQYVQPEKVYAQPQPQYAPAPKAQKTYVQPQAQKSYVQPQAQKSYVQPQAQKSYVQAAPKKQYVQPQKTYVQPQTEEVVEEQYDVQPQPQYAPAPKKTYAQPQAQKSYVQPQAQKSYVQPQAQKSYVQAAPKKQYVAPAKYEEPAQEEYTSYEEAQPQYAPAPKKTYVQPQAAKKTYAQPQAQKAFVRKQYQPQAAKYEAPAPQAQEEYAEEPQPQYAPAPRPQKTYVQQQQKKQQKSYVQKTVQESYVQPHVVNEPVIKPVAAVQTCSQVDEDGSCVLQVESGSVTLGQTDCDENGQGEGCLTLFEKKPKKQPRPQIVIKKQKPQPQPQACAGQQDAYGNCVEAHAQASAGADYEAPQPRPAKLKGKYRPAGNAQYAQNAPAQRSKALAQSQSQNVEPQFDESTQQKLQSF